MHSQFSQYMANFRDQAFLYSGDDETEDDNTEGPLFTGDDEDEELPEENFDGDENTDEDMQ